MTNPTIHLQAAYALEGSLLQARTMLTLAERQARALGPLPPAPAFRAALEAVDALLTHTQEIRRAALPAHSR
jgi:hypothetical protein